MVEASPAPIAPTPAPEAPPVDDLSYLYRQRPELVPAAEPVAPAPPEPASVEAAVAAATTLRARLVGDKAWGRSYLDGDVAKQNQMKALDRLRTAPPSDSAQLAALVEAAGIVPELPPAPLPPPPNPYFAENVKPSDYQPVHSSNLRSLPTFPDIDRGTKELAAMLSMPAALGKAVIEYIAEWSPRVANKMSEDERGRWLIQQHSTGMMRAGGPDAYEKMKVDARRALLEIGKDSPWSRLIADGAIMESWWLLEVLARHYRAHPRGRGRT